MIRIILGAILSIAGFIVVIIHKTIVSEMYGNFISRSDMRDAKDFMYTLIAGGSISAIIGVVLLILGIIAVSKKPEK